MRVYAPIRVAIKNKLSCKHGAKHLHKKTKGDFLIEGKAF